MPVAAQYFRVLSIVAAIPVAANAHTDRITGQDYRGFERNDGRGSCCNWHDCRPALAPIMERDGEKIIDLGGNKFFFDRRKLLKRPSDDGNWHVCGNGQTLYCIIAPAEVRLEPSTLDSLFGQLKTKPPASESLTPVTVNSIWETATVPICTAPY